VVSRSPRNGSTSSGGGLQGLHPLRRSIAHDLLRRWQGVTRRGGAARPRRGTRRSTGSDQSFPDFDPSTDSGLTIESAQSRKSPVFTGDLSVRRARGHRNGLCAQDFVVSPTGKHNDLRKEAVGMPNSGESAKKKGRPERGTRASDAALGRLARRPKVAFQPLPRQSNVPSSTRPSMPGSVGAEASSPSKKSTTSAHDGLGRSTTR
jgi:hypothetical protein